jgi:hypothetical protein
MAETDGAAGTIASILANLRNVPLWLLVGLAAASYALLFVAPVSNVNVSAFRNQWGIWFWIAAVAFSALAVAKAADLIAHYARNLRVQRMGRPLRVVPRTGNRRWTLTQQQDGSFVSQLSLDVVVANVTDQPVRVVAARLIGPNPGADLMNSVAMLNEADRVAHTFDAVPARWSATVNLFFLVHRKLAPQGTPLTISVGVTDQFGHEYRVKNLSIPSPQPRTIA